jgi:hypothetical protein
MAHVLSNDLLELHIDDPTEGYQFTRFDWTGKITQVLHRGIPLTRSEDPAAGDEKVLGKGFYNEFGIDGGLGFADAQTGEWFHKIGVGLLQKEGDAYQFTYPYPLKPASFRTDASEKRVEFRCWGTEVRGYAYELTKSIRLMDRGFRIDYALENTGSKPIRTDEYVHNFLGFGQENIAPTYRLTFPFTLRPGESGAVVNPGKLLKLEDNTVRFQGKPRDQFFFSALSADQQVMARWELVHASLGVGIRETGDFTTPKVNLWGWQHVVSPELFISLNVPPGEQKSWSREYEVFELGN